MNQIISIFNVLFMSAILLNTLSIQCMEKDYTQLALQAEEHNNNSCLLLVKLPNEKLIEVFSHCLSNDQDHVKSLENSIKTFMKLSSLCKSFNQLLTFEEIGNLCSVYAQSNKNQMLKNLTNRICLYYTSMRLPISILVCAGVDVNIGNAFLLEKATLHNDMGLVKMLFKYHANPNARILGVGPAFFCAKTVEMAQIFIDNGADIHATGFCDTNILWDLVISSYPSSLMEFYLNSKNKVDATKLRPLYKTCLFHHIAQKNHSGNVNDTDDFLKKVNLLLNAIPDMLNRLSDYDATPLDEAQISLKKAQRCNFVVAIVVFEKLIVLFQEHDALTAQELKQQEVSLNQQLDQQ